MSWSRAPRPVHERFFEKVSLPDPVTGCMLWLGKPNRNGYGTFWLAMRKPVPAHRWAYEYFHGPIPEGMDVDHDCHNLSTCMEVGPACLHRRCCAPEHLVARTRQDNLNASHRSPTQRDTCINGHPWTPENTHVRANRSGRECRQCGREQWHGRNHFAPEDQHVNIHEHALHIFGTVDGRRLTPQMEGSI